MADNRRSIKGRASRKTVITPSIKRMSERGRRQLARGEGIPLAEFLAMALMREVRAYEPGQGDAEDLLRDLAHAAGSGVNVTPALLTLGRRFERADRQRGRQVDSRRPGRDESEAEFRRSFEAVLRRYGPAFKALADYDQGKGPLARKRRPSGSRRTKPRPASNRA